jgi:hypothetical protein
MILTSQLAWDKDTRSAMVPQRFGRACCDSCPLLGVPAGQDSIVTNGTRLCDRMVEKEPRASCLPLDEIIETIRG